MRSATSRASASRRNPAMDGARLSEVTGEPSAYERLMRRIESRTAKVAVIGLGYVGIPLALATARAGFPVLGFDIDEGRAAQINRGESFIKHIPAEAVETAVRG